MAPEALLPPTAFSAAESAPISSPAGKLLAQLEQSWSQIAQRAGLPAPAIGSHLRGDFPQPVRHLNSREGDVALHRVPGEWWFRYADGVACRVAAGSPPTIDIEKNDGISLDHLLRLAGPLTAMLMDVCGFYPLHACGLALGQRMVAVHGRSGSGKSTLAAALAGTGIPVAGDDLLPLDDLGRVAGVGGSLRIAPRQAPPDWQPLVQLPDDRAWYALEPLPTLPLAGIFLLERGSRINVELLHGSDRLRAVLRSGFLSHLDPSPAVAWHERIVNLAGQVGVYQLVVPDSLDGLYDSREELASVLEGLVE